MSTPANALPTQADIEKRSREWYQAEYARAMRHLLNQGYTDTRALQADCRVLPPLVAVWHFEVKLDGKHSRVWVVTGNEMPIDHASDSVAGTARDALRHFYLHWQLKSAQLEQAAAEGRPVMGNSNLQQDYQRSMQKGAELLFKVVNEDRLWPEQRNA